MAGEQAQIKQEVAREGSERRRDPDPELLFKLLSRVTPVAPR
jgi:hypothetical protein